MEAEQETQRLREIAKTTEKYKEIAEVATLFVSYHLAYKNGVMQGLSAPLLEAAKTSVNTYLTQLVAVVRKNHGT